MPRVDGVVKVGCDLVWLVYMLLPKGMRSTRHLRTYLPREIARARTADCTPGFCFVIIVVHV